LAISQKKCTFAAEKKGKQMISIANPIYDAVFRYLMEDDRKVLNIDDTKYAGDSDMEHIVHRLLKAATNAKVRQDMKIEEVLFLKSGMSDEAIAAELGISLQEVEKLK
jgi:predicted RecB family endonuclease